MFNIKIPYVIGTHIKTYTAVAGFVRKEKAAAVGVLSGQFLTKHTSTAVAANVGAKAGATVTVEEYGFGGFLHKTVFTLTALPLTLADVTVGAGVKIYDFPVGMITVLNASGSVAETTTSAIATTLNSGVTYNWGVGTVTQANGTLATTEQNIINTTNGTSSTTINVAAAASSSAQTVAPLAYNGKTTAIDAFFNVGIALATDIDADATTEWTGTITMVWLFNGNV